MVPFSRGCRTLLDGEEVGRGSDPRGAVFSINVFKLPRVFLISPTFTAAESEEDCYLTVCMFM